MESGPSQALSDTEEMLFRQVHPSFVRDGRPSSQAFRPTSKDDRRLSVSRGLLTTAKDAYHHHTCALGLKSEGTWGVTVGECAKAGLKAYGDPVTSPPAAFPDPAHAVIDFGPFESRKQVEARGALLARSAHDRGCLYPLVPQEPDVGSGLAS